MMKVSIIFSSIFLLSPYAFAASTSFPEDSANRWELSEGNWNRYKEIADGYKEHGFEEKARKLLEAENKHILNEINIFKEKKLYSW